MTSNPASVLTARSVPPSGCVLKDLDIRHPAEADLECGQSTLRFEVFLIAKFQNGGMSKMKMLIAVFLAACIRRTSLALRT